MSTITEMDPASADDEKQAEIDAHRDPLSGRAGAHPIGTGLGAATGGAAVGAVTGMALGTVAGPVGTALGAAVGAAVGALGGGLAGKAAAEAINPTFEHGFWRQHYARSPYALVGTPYEEFGPAYLFGWESQPLHEGKSFDQAEPTLRNQWNMSKGSSILEWEHAKPAARDAWDRASQPHPGS